MKLLSSDLNINILAILVTRDPEVRLFRRVLDSIDSQLSSICVIDNESNNLSEFADYCETRGVKLIRLYKNVGIAAAYNIGFRLAKQHGYSWAITLDQDSVVPDGLIAKLAHTARTYSSYTKKLGIICPNFQNRTTGKKEYLATEITEIDQCISSGALTSVCAWENVNGFDEKMFIDGVDFDFCKRLKISGYSILLDPCVCMEHEIGNARLIKFLGHEIVIFNHSAFRKYYIAQNIVYLDGKFHNGHATVVAYIKVLRQLILVLLFENDKLEKMGNLLRGARHGNSLLMAIRDNALTE